MSEERTKLISTSCSADYVWRDLGDGNPVRVKKCPMCGVAPSAVDDCGTPNPDCPYFGRNQQELKLEKVKRRWWKMGSIHLVQTERYGKDKASDWVAVKDVQEAERIWHGGEIREILWVGNRLRDFKQNAKDQ